jgi:hypothetical protein
MIKTQQLLLQREPIKTRSARSEHSQGGAQRSEQYLYGAQRAIKSTLARVPALFKDILCRVLLNERANQLMEDR